LDSAVDSGFMTRPRIVAIRTTGTSLFFSAARHPPKVNKAIASNDFRNVRDCRKRTGSLAVFVRWFMAAHIIRPTATTDIEENSMKPKRKMVIGVTFLVLLAALGVAQKVLQDRTVAEAAGVQVPLFEVDPLWPKPLPNHWILGNTIGVSV